MNTESTRSSPGFLRRLARKLRCWVAGLRVLPRAGVELLALRREHDETVAWLRRTYPEIVAAVGAKLDEARFARHLEEQRKATREMLAVIHAEIDALARAGANGGTSGAAAAPRADYRMADFYLALEQGFRGTREQVRAKLLPYLDLLRPHGPLPAGSVIDIGCGRGEWLQLLGEAGIAARGIDLNPINGDACRAQGLDVETGDALEFLSRQPDDSVAAVSAFHLIEHLPFPTLLALTDEILRVLAPGGLLIYETPNPENLLVATRTFWHDPTHLRPLPPELIQFLVTQRGFAAVEIRRLHPAESAATDSSPLAALLAGPRDYAVIATKPGQVQAP